MRLLPKPSGYFLRNRNEKVSVKSEHSQCLTLPFTLARERPGTVKRETGKIGWTSETDQTRADINSSPAPAFSEAAGVVSTARIERPPLFYLLPLGRARGSPTARVQRGSSNSLYHSWEEWPRLPFTARIGRARFNPPSKLARYFFRDGG